MILFSQAIVLLDLYTSRGQCCQLTDTRFRGVVSARVKRFR